MVALMRRHQFPRNVIQKQKEKITLVTLAIKLIQPKKNNEYRTNLRNDGANQGLYNFSDEGEINSWKNLFVDRRKWITKISNEQISTYIDQDNYSAFGSKT